MLPSCYITGKISMAYEEKILRRYLQYVETRDDPSAEKVDWDFDKIWRRIPSGVPKEE